MAIGAYMKNMQKKLTINKRDGGVLEFSNSYEGAVDLMKLIVSTRSISLDVVETNDEIVITMFN
jgi:hypothetical protein